MRAPGHPQNCVLTEFAVDDLAAKLGIDPLVIRRKNLPPNDPKAKDPIAWPARRNTVYNEQLDIAAKLSGWKEKWHPPGKGKAGPIKHGIGMAIHTWGGFAAGGARRTSAASPSAATAPSPPRPRRRTSAPRSAR